jgi:hypothetical protein
MTLLLQLLALHALCDYPLQGDFMARAKNHRNPVPGVPWFMVLVSHALIHAGAVSLVLPWQFAVTEFFAHFCIDYAKNQGWLGPGPLIDPHGEVGFRGDQVLHVACKVFYWALA